MNVAKEQKMDMYVDRIVWYITYVDCLIRIIREFIENGDAIFILRICQI